MTNRVLDRLVEFDPASKNFSVRTLAPLEAPRKPRSYSWKCQSWLDQGSQGFCVGYAWAHELAARPSEVPGVTGETAQAIYFEAQKLDQWPGEKYSGTSVLGGIKAVQKLYPSLITAYHWAFSLEDAVLALGYHGPVVLGVNWYDDMFEPDSRGFVHASGKLAGGHAILARGVDIAKRSFTLHNSWGQSWGKNGDCYLSFDDFKRLASEDGEVCVPVSRKKLPRIPRL